MMKKLFVLILFFGVSLAQSQSSYFPDFVSIGSGRSYQYWKGGPKSLYDEIHNYFITTQNDNTPPKMVFVDGGAFTMGCTAEQDQAIMNDGFPEGCQSNGIGFRLARGVITPGECITETCPTDPLCMDWLRAKIQATATANCSFLEDIDHFEYADWNGTKVVVGWINGQPDGAGFMIFNCEGTVIQSCFDAFGTLNCNPDAGIDVFNDITNNELIWACNDPVPPADYPCAGDCNITVSLGTDLILCAGASAVLDPAGDWAAFQWSTGAVTPTITVNQEGVYSLIVTDVNGCTAADTATITVLSPNETSFTDAFCAGGSYDWNGQVYNSPGMYQQAFPDQNGCDSTVTLELTVLPPNETSFTDAFCTGGSYTWNGQVYTSPGTYQQAFPDQNGCDSTVTLELTVLPPTETSFTDAFCAGGSYDWNGQVYNSPGMYQQAFPDQNGCDSTVTLELTVLSPNETSFTDAFCPGGSYDWNGQVYNSPGMYQQVFSDQNGCDSTVTLELTVLPPNETSFSAAFCPGGSYTWNGQVYNSPGMYQQALPGQNGCDSTVTLTLEVSDVITTYLEEGICEGEGFTVGTESFSISGNYEVLLAAAGGCDSLVQLNLTVYPLHETAFSDFFCEGGSYTWVGQVYTTPGLYERTFTSVQGCDSLVQLELAYSLPATSSFAVQICEGDSFSWAGESFEEPGAYERLFTTAEGCDSLVSLQLSFFPKVAAVEDAFEVTFGGAELSFSLLSNDDLANGAEAYPLNSLPEGVSLEPNGEGLYEAPEAFWGAVAFDYLLCSTTCPEQCDTALVSLLVDRPFTPEEESEQIITPNGDGLNDVLIFDNIESFPVRELLIFSRWGDKVYYTKEYNNDWGGTNQNGQPLPQGAYYYVLRLDLGGQEVRTGNVLLVR